MVEKNGSAAIRDVDGDKGLVRMQASVRGRVQGVGFRYFTRQEAQQLGLRGYVGNCADGSVEVVAEGSKPLLDLLLARLWEGPRGAFVSSVDSEWRSALGEYDRFSVRF